MFLEINREEFFRRNGFRDHDAKKKAKLNLDVRFSHEKKEGIIEKAFADRESAYVR